MMPAVAGPTNTSPASAKPCPAARQMAAMSVALSLPIPFGSLRHSKTMPRPRKCWAVAAANRPKAAMHWSVSQPAFGAGRGLPPGLEDRQVQSRAAD